MDLIFTSAYKRADLMSTLGAALLGGGLALLLVDRLEAWAVQLTFLGLVVHAGGMFYKHRLEAGPVPGWTKALYWLCWLVLIATAIWIIAVQIIS